MDRSTVRPFSDSNCERTSSTLILLDQLRILDRRGCGWGGLAGRLGWSVEGQGELGQISGLEAGAFAQCARFLHVETRGSTDPGQDVGDRRQFVEEGVKGGHLELEPGGEIRWRGGPGWQSAELAEDLEVGVMEGRAFVVGVEDLSDASNGFGGRPSVPPHPGGGFSSGFFSDGPAPPTGLRSSVILPIDWAAPAAQGPERQSAKGEGEGSPAFDPWDRVVAGGASPGCTDSAVPWVGGHPPTWPSPRASRQARTHWEWSGGGAADSGLRHSADGGRGMTDE
ncbi:hypothetical protein TCAL_16206 [Tigriopus californicus]|uniref:Uncharacterized protein n=1 Tax=Tigriopus californicus TaxID=6832 RepID=A0A553P557_TIGCA|nr:hypothetical protein TCAL_16206 [Tigriopus californicus]